MSHAKVIAALTTVIAAKKKVIETPENLADYVKGHEGPPSPQELPEGYYDEVQAVIPKKSMMVYTPSED